MIDRLRIHPMIEHPEGIAFGRSIGPLPHVGFSSAPPEPPAPTAAQFGAAANTLVVSQSGGTLVSPGDTAAFGTPETLVATDSGHEPIG